MDIDIDRQPVVTVPTPNGNLRVRVLEVNSQLMLAAHSEEIPEVPIVRFQSSCVFGEAFHAVDCDCGAQVDAAIKLLLRDGGILIYSWEEGRGTGILNKVRAISLQQTQGLSTAEAFKALGHDPEPRDFRAQILALGQIFKGKRVRLASSNPKKIAAMELAGYSIERVKLNIEMTPERKFYLAHKRLHLGHLDDDRSSTER